MFLKQNITAALFFTGVVMFFIFPSDLRGQTQKFVTIDVKMKIEGGDMSGTYVVISKAGGTNETLPGSSRSKVNLDFNSDYILSFNKPGYITKKMEINTTVDPERLSQGFDGFEFTVVLFKQYDNVNIVVFNQPVGKYTYSKKIDDFDFDTDYTKTIQSQVQEAENQLKKKEQEEKSKPKQHPADSTLAVNKKPKPAEKPAPAQTVKTENKTVETPPKQTQQKDITPQTGDDKKNPIVANDGSDPKKKLNPSSGEDNKTPATTSGGADNKEALKTNSGEDNIKSDAKAVEGNDKKGNVKTGEGSDDKKSLATNSGNDIKKKDLTSGSGEDKEKKNAETKSGSDKLKSNVTTQSGQDVVAVVKIAPTVTTEIQKQTFIQGGETKVDREEINEDKKSIVNIRVTRGDKTVVYSKITYAWGGVYYFKDNKISISENLFKIATQGN